MSEQQAFYGIDQPKIKQLLEGTIFENGFGIVSQNFMRNVSIPIEAKAIYAYLSSFQNVEDIPDTNIILKELGIKLETFCISIEIIKRKIFLIIPGGNEVCNKDE